MPEQLVPNLSVTDDALVLTVEPDDLRVCQHCRFLHVLVFTDATPEKLREFAAEIAAWADRLEQCHDD
jgi:hypothetical protein